MRWIFLSLLFAASASAADSVARDPHAGARRLMQVFYQNCEAPNLAPFEVAAHGEMRGYENRRNEISKGANPHVVDLAEARASQYYARCSQPARAGCRDVCKTPPSYVWGGMGSYTSTGQGIELDPFTNDSHTEELTGHPGLDCSGFIHAAFAIAGLRVNPEMRPSAKTADTLTARTYMQPGKCFAHVAAGGELRPGDVIAWKKHVVMVDSAGADPFGLKSIHDVKDCRFETLDPDQFTLTVLNARGGVDGLSPEAARQARANPHIQAHLEKLKGQTTGVGVGISRSRWGDFVVSSPAIVMELALAACRAKFGASAETENVKIVRHRFANQSVVPAADRDCLARADEHVTIKGESCVASCR